jgi:hypothetical protein
VISTYLGVAADRSVLNQRLEDLDLTKVDGTAHSITLRIIVATCEAISNKCQRFKLVNTRGVPVLPASNSSLEPALRSGRINPGVNILSDFLFFGKGRFRQRHERGYNSPIAGANVFWFLHLVT